MLNRGTLISFRENMMLSRLLAPALLGALVFLQIIVHPYPAGIVYAQSVTIEDLLEAQAQGATEAELIKIYRSGLSVDSRDRYGATPLHVACWYKGCLYFAKMLLNAGADANSVRQKGWTPLMDASCEPGKTEIVSLLLKHGAQVDSRRYDGQSALHLSVSMDDLATARVLVDAGANVNLRDKHGRTPVYYARGLDVAKLLVESGAKLDNTDRIGVSPYRYVLKWEREHYGVAANDVSSYLKSLGAH
jgi:ankyrin repeat protein